MNSECNCVFWFNKIHSHSLTILYCTPCLIILFSKYCFALPATTLPCIEAVDSVCHINTVKELTESGNWWLSDKIRTLYNRTYNVIQLVSKLRYVFDNLLNFAVKVWYCLLCNQIWWVSYHHLWRKNIHWCTICLYITTIHWFLNDLAMVICLKLFHIIMNSGNVSNY